MFSVPGQLLPPYDSRPVGELTAYLNAPGVVLRCALCGEVQLRLLRTGERAWLDMRGVGAVQMRLPELST